MEILEKEVALHLLFSPQVFRMHIYFYFFQNPLRLADGVDCMQHSSHRLTWRADC